MIIAFFKRLSAKRNPNRETALTAMAAKTMLGEIKWSQSIPGVYHGHETGSSFDSNNNYISRPSYTLSYNIVNQVEISKGSTKITYPGLRMSPAGDQLWNEIINQTNPVSARQSLLNEVIS